MKREDIVIKIKNKLKVYLNYLILLFVVSLFLSLFRNISRIKTTDLRIQEAQERVNKLKKENEGLEARLKEAQSVQFVERQLRDKLGLAKEGEIVVILPEDDILRKLAPKSEEEESVLPDPNWREWLNLFL
jgi:cell division protein FtsB